MNADQLAMDRFGDFLKLLAQGCHVRIGGVVYKAVGNDLHYRSAILYDNPAVTWKARALGTIREWMEYLDDADLTVIHNPNQDKKANRRVRSVEL